MNVSGFAEECRRACKADWEAVIDHPFVRSLAEGSLTPARINTYLQQDGLYLAGYVPVCRTLARRSPTDADRALFEESAVLSEEGEQGMQAELRNALDLPPAPPAAPLPATRRYLEHEQHAAEDPSRLVALAAAIPCNWTYAEIGRRLPGLMAAGPSPHPYADWIALYAGDDVQDLARRWIDCLNRWAADASGREQSAARDAFGRSVRLEFAFWDQAWQAR